MDQREVEESEGCGPERRGRECGMWTREKRKRVRLTAFPTPARVPRADAVGGD